eukprot:gene58298-biopygen113602
MSDGERPNGHPLWKHAADDVWVFSSISGNWYFGDAEDKEQGFSSNSGYLCHPTPHDGQVAARDDWVAARQQGWMARRRRHHRCDKAVRSGGDRGRTTRSLPEPAAGSVATSTYGEGVVRPDQSAERVLNF